MPAALLLLVVTVAVALGLLEVAVRWSHAAVGSTADNTSYFAERWRAAHEGGRNSLGFREREIEPKAAGVTRIAVVGDSLTYGQGIDRAERFTDRLDAALGEATEVLNFGIPGANYPELADIMRVAIDAADPDAVILQWFVNDVTPPGERGPRPMNLAGPLHRFVQPYSALYFVANRGYLQLQHDFGLVASSFDYFNALGEPGSARGQAARERLEAVLDVADAAAVRHGIVLWPAATPQEAALGFTSHEPLFIQVLDVCETRRLSCLDLRPALRQVPIDRPLVVSAFDTHPNALANEVAAAAIHDWLMAPSKPPSS